MMIVMRPPPSLKLPRSPDFQGDRGADGPSRVSIRRKATADIGAPRSLMKTYRPGRCSRWRRRRARSSMPVNGWTDGIPFLSRWTCKRPWTRSTCSQRNEHNSDALKPVPESHQDHGGVPVPMPIVSGRLHQPFDLALGEVLAGAIFGIRQATRRDCSLYSAWSASARSVRTVSMFRRSANSAR
jgi:hypothetical protein